MEPFDPSPLPVLSFAPARLTPGRTIVFTFRVSTPELATVTYPIESIERFVRGVDFCNPPTPRREDSTIPQYHQSWRLTLVRRDFDGQKRVEVVRLGKFTSDVQIVTVEKLVPNALSMDFKLETYNGTILHKDIPIFRTSIQYDPMERSPAFTPDVEVDDQAPAFPGARVPAG